MIEKYHCFVATEENDFLLFNPYSFAVAVVKNPKGYSENNVVHALSKEQLKKLFDDDVFIRKRADAICMSKYFSDKVKYNSQLTISDAMTFGCNMNCVYCFENKTKNIGSELSTINRIHLIAQMVDLFYLT